MRRLCLIFLTLFLFIFISCSSKNVTNDVAYINERNYTFVMTPASSSLFPAGSNVTLIWHLKEGTSSHFVLLFGNDQANLGVLLYDTPATSYTFNGLSPGLYFWEVAVLKDDEIAAKSPIYMFEVSNKREGFASAPQLIYPVDGDIIKLKYVRFSWSKAVVINGRVIYYSLYLGKSPYQLSPVCKGLLAKEYGYYVTSYGTYYWKVVASDNRGHTISSPVWVFSVSSQAKTLKKPKLIYPASGAVLRKGIVFKWSGDGKKYNVYVSRNANHFIKIAETSGDSLHTTLSESGIYYWRVSYVENGVEVFSNIRWFRYDKDSYLKFRDVSVSAYDSSHGNGCAVTEDGKLYCWGYNDGTLPFQELFKAYTYTRVDFFSSVKDISLGYGGGCAIDSLGYLYCWENDKYSLYGGGYLPPHRIDIGERVEKVVVGDGFFCGLTKSGVVFCEGLNDKGQLGHGDYKNYTTPVTVSLAGKAVDITAGKDFVCALLSNEESNSLYCWGNNEYGQVGTGSVGGSCSTPQFVDYGWKEVSAGYNHVCGVKGEEVYCWGDNSENEVSPSSDEKIGSPVEVEDLPTTISVYSGDKYSCAEVYLKGVYCWGSNADVQDINAENGVSGFGRAMSFDLHLSKPTLVYRGKFFRKLSLSSAVGCGVTSEGDLYCWGDRRNRGIGEATIYETSKYFPPFYVGRPPDGWKKIVISTVTNINKMIYGNYFNPSVVDYGGDVATACGLTNGGDIYCWGYNYGNADPLSTTPHYRYFPRRMNIDQEKFKDLSISPLNIVGLTRDNRLYRAVNYNFFGSLKYYGWGEWHLRRKDINRVAAISDVIVFVDNDGDSYYFRDPYSYNSLQDSEIVDIAKTEGEYCLLGVNGMTCYFVYSSPPFGTFWVEMRKIYHASFPYDKLVLTSNYGETDPQPLSFCILLDGWISCYGDNSLGQLGVGRGVEVTALFEKYVVNDFGTRWKDIFGGEDGACALDVENNLWCWGDNRNRVFGEPAGIYYRPHLVTTLPPGLVQMDLNSHNGCGVDKEGNGWCWGMNYYGEKHTDYRDIPLRLESYSSPHQILIEGK